MKVPAYVCLLTGSHVCLSGGVGDLRAPLRNGPLSARLGRELGYLSLKFNETSGAHFENADLNGVMLELNRIGLMFGEDYKQGCSPADYMRELHARGILRTPFIAIAWRGPGEWFTSSVPPP